ncbi:MAG: ATP cone domain-containing protein, partial [Gammaproteobacteria bacterium]
DVVSFNPEKIRAAVAKAFLFDENGKPYASGQSSLSAAQRDQVDAITDSVTSALIRRMPSGGNVHIEDIQDQVELALMRIGEHKIARAYVLFRQRRANERAETVPARSEAAIEMVDANGATTPITAESLLVRVEEAVHGLDGVDAKEVAEAAFRDLYNGVPEAKVSQALVLAARSRIEQAPDYAKLAARLLLIDIRQEVLGEFVMAADMPARYVSSFPEYIRTGIGAELLDERLAQFDLGRLAAALVPERD